MKFKRSSGILLHPTSLPGPYGIGDIGARAHRWIDFLSGAGCGLWQVLPIGPTGYGDSPYQCFSSFAGNPLLISPEALLRDDLLHPDDLSDHPSFPEDRVDFGEVIPWKSGVLDRSFIRFQHTQSPQLKSRDGRIPGRSFRLVGRLCFIHGPQRSSWRRTLAYLGETIAG